MGLTASPLAASCPQGSNICPRGSCREGRLAAIRDKVDFAATSNEVMRLANVALRRSFFFRLPPQC
jgi:hypothetical protein